MARSAYRAFRYNWYFHRFVPPRYARITALDMSVCAVRSCRSSEKRASSKNIPIYHERGVRARESSILDEEFNDYPVSKLNSSCRDDREDERKIDLAKLTQFFSLIVLLILRELWNAWIALQSLNDRC